MWVHRRKRSRLLQDLGQEIRGLALQQRLIEERVCLAEDGGLPLVTQEYAQ